MMYLALTYDHRLLDGREAVTFLVKVCHASSLPITHTHLLIPIIDQGIHRRPATDAAWVIELTVCTLLVGFCLSCLEMPWAPFVDYRMPKYNCHIKDSPLAWVSDVPRSSVAAVLPSHC